MLPTRHIHKSSWRCQDEVRELLQAIFVTELFSPSPCIWLVSPWISDIPIIDNRMRAFDALDPSWGPRLVRLTEVLGKTVIAGARLVIATRPLPHNRPFLDQMRTIATSAGLSDAVEVKQAEDLHEKGLLGRGYYLSGSMNLTYGGVELLEEAVKFDTAPEVVAEAQLVYFHRWGGVLPSLRASDA